ncbi:hypothetical protein [Nonomuraea sp. NPDC050783]|uniref:hypothetical protein n=1 Tax=Nonomuraea sp. NPDC050783 TaxID=3154634 RepID=UPI0034673F68
MTRNDIETLTEQNVWGAFTNRETTLGGHLGPDEGRTSLRIPAVVTDKHPWFEANPEWWVIPEPERRTVNPMIRVAGHVYPANVLAFLITVERRTAEEFHLAA